MHVFDNYIQHELIYERIYVDHDYACHFFAAVIFPQQQKNGSGR